MFNKKFSSIIVNEIFVGRILIILTVFVCIAGLIIYLPTTKIVSSTVGDRELPIYCVDTDENKVAISFDAAWGSEQTDKLLDILAQYNIHATFFMTGGWVSDNPDYVKKIAEAGHDLGNHSETHPEMSKLSKEKITEELMSVHNKVKELTGYEMKLFRPPYGDYNNTLVTTASECNYYCIQWSVDSLDWKNYGTQKMVDTILNHKALGNGAIILMHNGGKYTAEALPAIIEGLMAKGYEIVPISELIMKDNYHMDSTGKQIADQAAN